MRIDTSLTELDASTQADSIIDRFELRHGSSGQTETFEDDGTNATRNRYWLNQAWQKHDSYPAALKSYTRPKPKSRAVPLGVGSRHTYSFICSEDDPARSIAICPKRQCVAFGTQHGLDLHWIDKANGQDMNRQFPLLGSSDYLFFLPPRMGMLYSQRLRLVSSALHPVHERERLRVELNYENLAEESEERPLSGMLTCIASSGVNIVSDGDHYHAVPLVDGIHFLFIDPRSSMLCFGADHTNIAPRRLIRKVALVSPTRNVVPHIFASSPNLNEGPLIVAAYRDTIVAFRIPSDVYAYSQREQSSRTLREEDRKDTSIWRDWWDNNPIPPIEMPYRPLNAPADPAATTNEIPEPELIWPIYLPGILVGSVHKPVALCVNQEAGRSTIWAFSAEGEASVWQIGSGGMGKSKIMERAVARDGLVLEACEVDDQNVHVRNGMGACKGKRRSVRNEMV